MSVARTARRRRKQYAGGFNTMVAIFGSPRHTPNYRKKSAAKSAKQMARMLAKQKAMQTRNKKG